VAEAQRRIAAQASDFNSGSAQQSAAPSITNVLLLTSDDELWIQLKDLVSASYNVQQADSIEQTIETWPPGQSGVFVWDIRAESQINRGLTKLQHHSASLVPMVIDKDPASDVVAALVRQRAIVSRLTLPLSQANVSAALEAARDEANTRATLFGTQRSGSSSDSSGRSVSKLVGLAIAALVLIGGGTFWWMSRPTQPPGATAAPAASTAAVPATASPAAPAGRDVQTEQVEPLLAKARSAMRDKRYDEPENDCALAYYKNVLVFDSANGEARQGLDRIAEVLLMRAETAFEQHNYDNALRSVETARSIRPDHPRLAALDAQISQRRGELALAQIQAAMQAQSFDRAQQLIREAQQSQSVPADALARLRAELGRRQADTEMSDTLKLLQARLQQGRLIDPESDSAKYYLAAARKKPNAASNSQLQSLAQDFTRALLQEARSAAGKQQSADVDKWLGEARDAGVPARDLQALQRELTQQAQKPRIDVARTTQLISERIGQGRLAEPANDSALFYLSALKSADSKNTGLAELTRRLAAEFATAARTALDDNRVTDAESALQNAHALGAGGTDIAALDQRLAHSKAIAEQSKSVVPAGTLKLTRPISPVYPEEALRTGAEGWVELEFTVGTDGKVTEAEVTNSQPKNVFDRAAINAMRHARYEPVLVDGQAVPQRAHFRIAFKLDSRK
jgi:TonB family protein